MIDGVSVSEADVFRDGGYKVDSGLGLVRSRVHSGDATLGFAAEALAKRWLHGGGLTRICGGYRDLARKKKKLAGGESGTDLRCCGGGSGGRDNCAAASNSCAKESALVVVLLAALGCGKMVTDGGCV
ncbi:hypothetical protein LR48_Vigan02g090900 [Vigna angularis]|uniref:Uncharacterized protein n=1 Tax=Phaseolus angularis TaxID=3914 RepID=A0A0L9TX49_PHAAN|nr:hypothetical protein LR48_Vigan02g090900 [Vigna angularis]